jgi:hypothetical protein
MTTTLEQRLFDGNRAKEVLENEAFIAAFEGSEKEVIEQWMNSPARDAEGREKLWNYLMLLRKVKAHIMRTLETGKLAKLELEHRQTLAARLKTGLGL